MLKLTTKLMNMFSYYITTHFISSNKDYNFYRNPHSMYRTYPSLFKQHSTYFRNIFSPTCISKTLKQLY